MISQMTIKELEARWAELDAKMWADEAALLADEIDKEECARRSAAREAERRELSARAIELRDGGKSK